MSVMPERRNLKFNLPRDRALDWQQEGRHITLFFNTLSIFFPVGERFFIDSLRNYRDELKDPELVEAVRQFIGQEAMHGREHEEYNDALLAAGLNVDKHEAQVTWLLDQVQKYFPKSTQLAVTSGLEHMTALMGDYLLSRCFQMIGQSTTRENALGLAAATGHLVRSELDQLDQRDTPRLSRRAYLRRIAGKTAILFALSLTTGAHEAGAKRRVVGVLARAGYAMGMAFQIIDDVLDFTADESRLGKPIGTDLRIGLYTLPVIEAVGREPALVAALADEIDVTAMIARVRQAGGIHAARNVAAAYTARAQSAIDLLPAQPVRAGLSMLVRSLLARDH